MSSSNSYAEDVGMLEVCWSVTVVRSYKINYDIRMGLNPIGRCYHEKEKCGHTDRRHTCVHREPERSQTGGP